MYVLISDPMAVFINIIFTYKIWNFNFKLCLSGIFLICLCVSFDCLSFTFCLNCAVVLDWVADLQVQK